MLKIQSLKSLLTFIQSLNCNPQSKTGNQMGKLQTLHLHGWCQSSFQISKSFFVFVDCNKLLFLGCFHSLFAAFLSRYPMALASQISWGLQGNFNVTASCFNVWDPHMVFCVPLKGWGHVSSSALCSTLSSGYRWRPEVNFCSPFPLFKLLLFKKGLLLC